ncbi:MAG: GNAT family N-acetyltransferase [Pseudomonadota bacterium]
MQYRVIDYPRDTAAVIDLWTRLFPDDPPWNAPAEVIARKAAVQGELFWVCCDGPRLIGTVMAGDDGVRGWIHKLATDPDYRGQGVARELMQIAIQALRKTGCVKLNLQVRAGNPATEFYRAMGMTEEDRISFGMRL